MRAARCDMIRSFAADALILPHTSSVTGLPARRALSSNSVTGRSWVIGELQSSGVSSGSAFPTSAMKLA